MRLHTILGKYPALFNGGMLLANINHMCGDCDYIADCIHDFHEHTHSPNENNENSLYNEISLSELQKKLFSSDNRVFI